MNTEEKLWRYFKDVNSAIRNAKQDGSLPYVNGNFMVTALAGEVELSVSSISEEDAILIASELKDMGVKAVIRDSVLCPNCQERVPKQDYCVQCRNKL